MERLSNNLARVKRLNDLRGELEEGYFPKLDSLVSSRVWPPRFANSKLSVGILKLIDIVILEIYFDNVFCPSPRNRM